MDKLPAHRTFNRPARNNPADLPSTSRGNPRSAPGNSSTSPAIPGASARVPPYIPPHARVRRAQKADGSGSPAIAPGTSAETAGRSQRPVGKSFPSEVSGSRQAPKAPRERDTHPPRPRNPLAASLRNAPSHPADPESPRTLMMRNITEVERAAGNPQSIANGFKLMEPHVQDAVRQAQRILPANIPSQPWTMPEHSIVFHQNPVTGRLEPGSILTGNEVSVPVPYDLEWPTARVHIHSHPFTATPHSISPSMLDQNIARKYPNMDFIVQTPALAPGQPNGYVIYNGAYPPRFYFLVENPGNLPVRPHSPDMNQPPPFKPHPYR